VAIDNRAAEAMIDCRLERTDEAGVMLTLMSDATSFTGLESTVMMSIEWRLAEAGSCLLIHL